MRHKWKRIWIFLLSAALLIIDFPAVTMANIPEVVEETENYIEEENVDQSVQPVEVEAPDDAEALTGANDYDAGNVKEFKDINRHLYANTYDGLTITGGSVTKDTDGQIKLTENGAAYEISGTWNGTLTGLNMYAQKAVLTVPSGVTVNVTLNSVTITKISSTDYACAFAVEAGGTANITLKNTNTLASGYSRAGLEVPEGATVKIDGDGSLTANGGYEGSGIGSGSGKNGGSITINDGIVTANGGDTSSGIGGGNDGNGGIITINGGTVTANGKNGGSGIGGGSGGSGGSGGIITINGGTVIAQGGSGIVSGSGIGSGGGKKGNSGTITIRGGTVTAQGGSGGGSSASSYGGDGGTVEISGKNTRVIAKSIHGGYDIGGGSGLISGAGGSLSVTGGAILEMKDTGTNAADPVYINCTVIDKNGKHVYYTLISPTLTLEANPANSLTLPGEGKVTLTATLSDAFPDGSGKTIIFTVNSNSYPQTTNSSGIATYTITDPQQGTYTFGASFAGNELNNPVSAAEITGYMVNNPPHIHSYGSEWVYDGTTHWKQCSCGATFQNAAHEYGDWSILQDAKEGAPGTTRRECTVCHYEQTETNTCRTLTDAETGIKISGYFTSDAALSVKEATLHESGTCPVCDEICTRQTAGELLLLYDIILTSGIHNGGVGISFPVDAKYNGKTLFLLHCMDRQEERLEIQVKDGVAAGTFKSLSPFAVLDTTKVSSITLTPSSLTLELGKSRQLQAALSPADAYDPDVIWKSSKDSIATVSDSGLVTAVKAGTTTITCTAADDGGAQATCKVTVRNTDTPILTMRATAGKNSVRLNWNQISNADGYEIYGSRCGKKYSYKKIKTIGDGATKTWTQKKLKSATAYKYYIKAYKLVNGRKLYLRVSKTCHTFTTGGKYTNVKAVTATFTDITLSKGKTRQISARVTPVKKGGKLANHVPKFRYKTTNSKVATVTASGKIKAAGKGKCSVYVYANNGVTRRIMITVK